MTSISADYFEDEKGLYKHRAAAWGAGIIVFVILIVLTSQFSKSKDAIEKVIITSTEIDTLTSGVNSSEAMAAAAGRKTSDGSKVASADSPAPQMGRPKTQRMEIKIEQQVVEQSTDSNASVRVNENSDSDTSPSVIVEEITSQPLAPNETLPPAQQPNDLPSNTATTTTAQQAQSSGSSAAGDGAGTMVNGALDATGESLENIGVKELSQIKIAYPPQAYHLNRDGYVEIQYSINKEGGTKDIKIVSSDPPGMFDKSAISSISKMKYSPMIVNGAPVEVVNVRKFIAFNGQDN